MTSARAFVVSVKIFNKHKMRRNVSVKILLCIISLSFFLLWYNTYRPLSDSESVLYNVTRQPMYVTKSPNLIYILQWTKPGNVPFVYMGVGQEQFIKYKCQYTNCYVTSDRYYLEQYTLFDVIVFAGPEVIDMYSDRLPTDRSDRQKYVFASIESSQNYPLCADRFDNYFNWTWTFRLDSESRWGYFIIRDKQNKVIGPNKVMHWIELDDMEPVTDDFKRSLKTKTKAAAWFVSNCFSRSKREIFVRSLKRELLKYNLFVDVFGTCGSLSCPRNEGQRCEDMIKSTYYFYLSLENSISEDYVTEKLLLGLENNAIPIVYGGANYSRFMPDGIYLNGKELGPAKVAQKMDELIRNPDKYAEYFKWKNHYSYHNKNDNSDTDDYCSMCALLNNKEKLTNKSVYKNFRKWWDSPSIC